MFTTIKGYYEHGQVMLQELPPVTSSTKVLITFLTDDSETQTADAEARQNEASFSGVAERGKKDTSGYVVLESGLGIDE